MFYLVVGRQFHCRNAVDVLFDLVEEVVPASDQTTLVLVVHQIKLIRVPHFTDLKTQKKKTSCCLKTHHIHIFYYSERTSITYLFEELLQCHFTLGYQENIFYHHFILLQVHIPDLSQCQLWQNPVDMETLHELLPVAVLQSLGFQLNHQHVNLKGKDYICNWVSFSITSKLGM